MREIIVSKTVLSQNFGSLDWRPEPVTVGQKVKNTPTLREPLTQIILFIETRRLVESAEDLSSSLAESAGELWPAM